MANWVLALIVILIAAFPVACGGRQPLPTVDSLLQLLPQNVDAFTFADLERLRAERLDDLETLLHALTTYYLLEEWQIDIDDVDSLIVSGLDSGDALTLLRGAFSMEDIEDALGDQGFRDSIYRDVTVWSEQGGDVALALVGDDVVVVGEEERVEEALDVFLDDTQSAYQDEETTAIVDSMEDALLYSVAEECDYRGCRRAASGVRLEGGDLAALFAYGFRDEDAAYDAEREIENDLEELVDDPDVSVDGPLVVAVSPVEEDQLVLDRDSALTLTTVDGEPAQAAPQAVPTRAQPTTAPVAQPPAAAPTPAAATDPTPRPMAAPVVTSGTLVSGTILFNGRPLSEYTDKTPQIWAASGEDGSYPSTNISYDNSTGEYEIRGLPPGEYYVGFYVDVSQPFDGQLGMPLDLLNWKTLKVPDEQTVFEFDIDLPRVIRLNRPVDSINGLTNEEDPAVYPAGPLEIAWDPIEEANSYEVRIEKNWPDNQYAEGPLVDFNETVLSTSLEVNLPISDADEWYELSVYAYDSDGRVVGQLVIEEEGGYVFRYQFRIVRPEAPAPTATPQLTHPQGSFASVSAGRDHTCGVTTSGGALCWGDVSYGQATPPADVSFASVSAGDFHTCGVTTTGDALCWGSDEFGEATLPADVSFTSVSAGWYYTCGVTASGDALCWGDDNHGRAKPPDGVSFASVSAGRIHTCGVTTSGDALCWGSDRYGQATPPADVSFTTVSAGRIHTCGVTTSGDTLCWGADSSGETTPPAGASFVSVSAGGFHTCGVTTSGDALCWGRDWSGQATPPTGVSFASVGAGDEHTCGVTTSDDALCWGEYYAVRATLPAGVSFSSVSAADLVWRTQLSDDVYAAPTIVGGMAYVGAYDGNVYALDALNGEIIWNYRTGDDDLHLSPTVADGIVYIGSPDHHLYALDAVTGELRWRYETGGRVESSPMASKGVVYVGSIDHHVYALDAVTGELRWRYETGADVDSSPMVSKGVVYVGSEDDWVYALDAATGELHWRYETGADVNSSPMVSKGVVYVGSEDRHVYALGAVTGELRWRYETGDNVTSSPMVSDSIVYFGSQDGQVYVLDASTGRLLWRYEMEIGYGHPNPTAVAGVVYVGSDDGHVYALDAVTGELRWRYETGGQVRSSPSVSDGIVYFGSRDGHVYALRESERQ